MVGCGIGPGDEVLVPAYTWVATAAAPLAVGAVPVLTEINQTLTIDPDDIRRKISPRTKAIIVVHMLNLVCDMDAIMAIAKEHDLLVIEDACQAVGVTYRGRRCGTIGDAGAFSFNVHKNIQAGEGGAVLTNSQRAYTRALMYHDVGSYIREGRADTSEAVFIGQNYRMTNLAAAILRAQIPSARQETEAPSRPPPLLAGQALGPLRKQHKGKPAQRSGLRGCGSPCTSTIRRKRVHLDRSGELRD